MNTEKIYTFYSSKGEKPEEFLQTEQHDFALEKEPITPWYQKPLQMWKNTEVVVEEYKD